MNKGHRLYGDIVKPENSLKSLKEGLKHQSDKNFKEWETDVGPSAEGIFYCYHDWAHKDISRLVKACPTYMDTDYFHRLREKPMQEIYSMNIDRFTISYSRWFFFEVHTGEIIPSLDRVLFELDGKIKKDLNVEIKWFNQDSDIKVLYETLRAFQYKNPRIEVYTTCRRSRYNKIIKQDSVNIVTWFKESKRAGIRFKRL